MIGRDSVKDIITKSFIELLKEKRIDDISINALTDYAKVGRVSFYRNFADKDDILRYYIDTETSRWLESSDINYLTVSSPQAYVVFLLEQASFLLLEEDEGV